MVPDAAVVPHGGFAGGHLVGDCVNGATMRPSRHPGLSHVGLMGSVVLAALHAPVVLVGVVVLLGLVYAGVVVPAVWFRQPARRRDARAVLQQLLDALRSPRDP